jgi:hypothetical protein
MHWVLRFAGKLDVNVREVQRRGGRRRGHGCWDCSLQRKGWEGGGRQRKPTDGREVSENLVENPRRCELEAASDLVRWIGAMDFLAVAVRGVVVCGGSGRMNDGTMVQGRGGLARIRWWDWWLEKGGEGGGRQRAVA